MNCYRHQSIPAVGTCKNCSKGLCPDCSTEVDNSLACTETCIDEVKTLNALITRNNGLSKRAAGSYYRAAFVSGAIGLISIYSGIVSEELRFYMYPVGVVFLLAAVSGAYSISKIKK